MALFASPLVAHIARSASHLLQKLKAFRQLSARSGLSNTSKNTTFDDMLGQRTEHVMGRWTSSHPADIAWRREQMGFNNDIAGLARCP